jgi:outer membrane protein OmpU
MKNITKKVVVLFSSLFLSVSAFAGELTVTGSADASYVVNGGQANNDDKGLGISNELMFSASGELDNGYTWNYHMELDPNGGGTTDNDDTALTINTNGMGTIGIFDSEGGLSTELGYGVGVLGVGLDYANTMADLGHTLMNWGLDVSSYPNVQYHFPADVLPFGIGAKIGYAPNTSDGDSNSFKNSGGANTAGADGGDLTQYQLTAAPIDGLKVGADYAEAGGESGVVDQEQSGGNVYAQYAVGNLKFGYMTGYKEAGKATYADGNGSSYDSYEYDAIAVEFALNDAVTVSYDVTENEAKDKGTIAAGNASRTTQIVTMELILTK